MDPNFVWAKVAAVNCCRFVLLVVLPWLLALPLPRGLRYAGGGMTMEDDNRGTSEPNSVAAGDVLVLHVVEGIGDEGDKDKVDREEEIESIV